MFSSDTIPVMSETAILPEFITDAVEETPGYDPTGKPTIIKTALNFIWWATSLTARAIAARYGAKAVPMTPYYPASWTRATFNPASQWYLQFPDGTVINAGILADYFRRNPEAEYPGLADKYVRDYIAAAEAGR
jgi:hypothetical protein